MQWFKGQIEKVDLNGMTLEEWCENYIKEKYPERYSDVWCDEDYTWVDFINDEYSNEVLVIPDLKTIYLFNDIEYDFYEKREYCVVVPTDIPNVFNFETYFWNGRTAKAEQVRNELLKNNPDREDLT